ncbi:MAG: peptidylprolyl isomerase [Victivallaceae bacterium]|nr:peptidylprolyl isomerase [Victivallaceae bacterium]
MKKSSLFVTAVLAAAVINAGEKAPAAKAVKKAAPAKKIQKIQLTPEMMKQLQAKQSKPIDWSFLPETIAEVGGKKLGKQALINFFNEQMKMMPYQVRVTTEQVKKFAPQMVDQLVSQQLLIGLAGKAGFKPSAKLVEDTINANLKKMKPAQLQMMKQQMVSRKTTLEQFIKKQSANPMVQAQYAIGEWVKSKATAVKPTDAEVKEFYKKNKDNPRINQALQLKMSGDPAGSVRASHILIKTDKDEKAAKAAKAKAETILAKLKKGGNFAELAKANSEGPSGKNGGSLGAFKKGQMVKEFEAAAFNLKPGEVSGLVKTKFGYHIIRRDKSAETKYFPYDTVKEKIAAFLTAQSERSVFAGIIKTELKKAKAEQKVKIFVKAKK